ncbi:SDR family NAD(P)-dependent oxidoreductase [Intrasporangium sp.]|uniref:SDR family NAD(P)-dependent oxidoreductase n=1 Tax=Intrasporangium sp. TaxID=1925024 RepID=UPI00293A01C1|nr:SDR family NAD(P)-dependent oxidoreductase [Intrasporangium sp.]MDV3222935.1 SDR family oxidoreductase [Intrasporangium sp.]
MTPIRTALITGASQGLGRALAGALAARGWRLLLTARTAADLSATADALPVEAEVVAVPGDVSDADHRDDLRLVVDEWGRLDVLVNNASTLGPTPLRPLRDLTSDELAEILSVNVVAPHALARLLLPALEVAGGVVLDISSDAAVEHYETWGGYGASKAALDHLTLTLGAEQSRIRAYALDPGDMRTAMHQSAFPGEDISDRPLPSDLAVPAALSLLDRRPESGRYRASDLLTDAPTAPAATAPTGAPPSGVAS